MGADAALGLLLTTPGKGDGREMVPRPALFFVGTRRCKVVRFTSRFLLRGGRGGDMLILITDGVDRTVQEPTIQLDA